MSDLAKEEPMVLPTSSSALLLATRSGVLLPTLPGPACPQLKLSDFKTTITFFKDQNKEQLTPKKKKDN